MPLFSNVSGRLKPIIEKKIDLEKDVQSLTENNLELIFGLKFVSTEFALHNLRIDTLAYDEESKCFVIIEYKRDRSFSVVDQGFAYLSLMLNNKADFILEYNENSKGNLKRDDVDWSQSKVIFVANSFTAYQQEAIKFKDMQFELWEVKKYDNSTILYNQLKADKPVESINLVTTDSTVKAVSRELKSYTVEDHFKENWTSSKELFNLVRSRILNFDDRLVELPQKYYIGYKIDSSLLVTIHVYKLGIELQFKRSLPSDFIDPEENVYYVKDSLKYYNQNISGIMIKDVGDVEYAISMLGQAYGRFVA